MRHMIFFGIAITVLVGSSALATEWRVEWDGSGDFVVIQDAVDAAQNGDTILIGPGRFPETSDFHYYNSAIVPACVIVEKSLVFLGSGQGETIIGPLEKNEYDTYGFGSISSGLFVEIRNLSIHDCGGASILFDMGGPTGRLIVENVEGRNCYTAIGMVGTTNSRVQNCSFQDLFGYSGMKFLGTPGLELRDCHIQALGTGVNIQFPSTQGVSVSNCHIEGGLSAVYLVDVGNVIVEDCVLASSNRSAIRLTRPQNVQVRNITVLGEPVVGLTLRGGEGLIVQNSIFTGSLAAVYIYDHTPGMVFENNHLLPPPPGAWYVKVDSGFDGPPAHCNMTNNYWGTTDPEVVSELIYDGYDDAARPLYIDFEPMADGPVGTTRTTLGGLKALFR